MFKITCIVYHFYSGKLWESQKISNSWCWRNGPWNVGQSESVCVRICLVYSLWTLMVRFLFNELRNLFGKYERTFSRKLSICVEVSTVPDRRCATPTCHVPFAIPHWTFMATWLGACGIISAENYFHFNRRTWINFYRSWICSGFADFYVCRKPKWIIEIENL